MTAPSRPNAPVLSPDDFRGLLGCFASGVTVVTMRDEAGRPHGMTVSSFASLSIDPPLVLACIDRAASMHDLLAVGDAFAVNVLAASQLALSLRFSQVEMELRFEGVPYSPTREGAPAIEGVHAVIECRVVARHDGGDHGIFVGEVVGGTVGGGEPLLYHRGAYPGAVA